MPAAPETTAQLLALLRDHGPERLCTRYRRPPLPSKLLRALCEEGDPEGLRFVARYPLSPSDLLEQLAARTEDTAVAALLAANPRTPPPVLSAFIGHSAAQVRAAAALHPGLHPREILNLLRDSDPFVVRCLAGNPGLKSQHQACIARHEDPSVRMALAGNTALDPQVVRVLGDDESPLVRFHTAAQARADKNQLLMWADSDDPALQHGLLLRKAPPPEILESLALSAHTSVRTALAENHPPDPAARLFVLDHGTAEERAAHAADPALPRPVQRMLCQSDDTRTRSALAANPAIDTDIAEYLCQSGSEAEILALLANPSKTPAWHGFIVRSGHPHVNAALVYEDDLDPRHLHELVNRRLCPETTVQLAAARRPFRSLRADLATALATHPWPALRALAAGSKHLPHTLLRKLTADPVPTVAAAAANPNADTPAPAVESIPAARGGDVSAWLSRIDHTLESITRGTSRPSVPTFQTQPQSSAVTKAS
ncbi:MAG: hypothetical protein JJU00_11265 [Opitutales bacterium]|nr:hypothetical protein [Opitutales bacterium]